ncbi:hypothetical protein QOT17_25570 [Balamuthia mandrillaris]
MINSDGERRFLKDAVEHEADGRPPQHVQPAADHREGQLGDAMLQAQLPQPQQRAPKVEIGGLMPVALLGHQVVDVAAILEAEEGHSAGPHPLPFELRHASEALLEAHGDAFGHGEVLRDAVAQGRRLGRLEEVPFHLLQLKGWVRVLGGSSRKVLPHEGLLVHGDDLPPGLRLVSCIGFEGFLHHRSVYVGHRCRYRFR